MSRFALAQTPTPVLNVGNFTEIFGKETLPLDKTGLLRPVEMIALPKTKFEILNQVNDWIAEVKTLDYPCRPLFVDTRFLTPCLPNIPERQKILPPREKILTHLQNSLGLPYIWGGNWGKGIPEILSFYHSSPIDPKMHAQWILQGLDCSGLLYEATQGYTPRNTSDLLHFGNPILIENKQIKTIVAELLPLDLIIWKGHVIIVFDDNQVIESVQGRHGVVLTDLKTRLEQILFQEKRTPRNSWIEHNIRSFVIRRFLHFSM